MLSLDLEALEVQGSKLSSRWNRELGCHVCRAQLFFFLSEFSLKERMYGKMIF